MKETLKGVGLLLVDIQNDFIDGALATEDALSILPTVKKLIEEYPFQLIVSSQDFHPSNHISFASQHVGSQPFQLKKLAHPISTKAEGGEVIEQMLWPDHCIQGTTGCEFHPEIVEALETKKKATDSCPMLVVQKGQNPKVDGYSAFSLNHYFQFTELPKLLFSQQPPIHTLVVVGLATDYCVSSSAIDSVKFGLRTIVVKDAMRGATKDTTNRATQEMKDWGIEVLQSEADLRRSLLNV